MAHPHLRSFWTHIAKEVELSSTFFQSGNHFSTGRKVQKHIIAFHLPHSSSPLRPLNLLKIYLSVFAYFQEDMHLLWYSPICSVMRSFSLEFLFLTLSTIYCSEANRYFISVSCEQQDACLAVSDREHIFSPSSANKKMKENCVQKQ